LLAHHTTSHHNASYYKLYNPKQWQHKHALSVHFAVRCNLCTWM
jgi:hypothetical protein